MLVREIGEFELIDLLAQVVAGGDAKRIKQLGQQGFRLRLGIGDDAAAWESPAGVRVLTTDTLVEGVHFKSGQISWRDLGWKAFAVNLSDVAAMGCMPLYAVVTLGLRGDLPVEGLEEMYLGILEACGQYGGAVAGGDVVRSPVFFVTVALEGTVVASRSRRSRNNMLLTRSAASRGDKIAVTGNLGCSAGGLKMLAEEVALDPKTARHLGNAHYCPQPRLTQGITLVQHGVLAAMDISDGLVDDLGKLCKASGVGAVLYADLVPVDSFLKKAFPGAWLELALGGGEDYELLFTAPEAVMDRVLPRLGMPATIIGDIREGPHQVRVMDAHGKVMPVAYGGWDHLRGNGRGNGFAPATSTGSRG